MTPYLESRQLQEYRNSGEIFRLRRFVLPVLDLTNIIKRTLLATYTYKSTNSGRCDGWSLLVEILTVQKNNQVFTAILLNNDIFHDHRPFRNRDGTLNGRVG